MSLTLGLILGLIGQAGGMVILGLLWRSTKDTLATERRILVQRETDLSVLKAKMLSDAAIHVEESRRLKQVAESLRGDRDALLEMVRRSGYLRDLSERVLSNPYHLGADATATVTGLRLDATAGMGPRRSGD